MFRKASMPSQNSYLARSLTFDGWKGFADDETSFVPVSEPPVWESQAAVDELLYKVDGSCGTPPTYPKRCILRLSAELLNHRPSNSMQISFDFTLYIDAGARAIQISYEYPKDSQLTTCIWILPTKCDDLCYCTRLFLRFVSAIER